MSRTWTSRIALVFIVLGAAGCGSQVMSTRVAVVTQPPPTETAPPPTATAARKATAAEPPTSPTATKTEATLAPASPTATTAASAVTTGLTEDGHHFQGAPNAPVTMIDFSDFM